MWMALICPDCGSEIEVTLRKSGKVIERCTNPNCPSRSLANQENKKSDQK